MCDFMVKNAVRCAGHAGPGCGTRSGPARLVVWQTSQPCGAMFATRPMAGESGTGDGRLPDEEKSDACREDVLPLAAAQVTHGCVC